MSFLQNAILALVGKWRKIDDISDNFRRYLLACAPQSVVTVTEDFFLRRSTQRNVNDLSRYSHSHAGKLVFTTVKLPSENGQGTGCLRLRTF